MRSSSRACASPGIEPRMSDTDSIETAAGRCALRRSARRTLAISVLPDGTVELRAPRDAAPAVISAKVGKRLRWITKQRGLFAEMNKGRAPVHFKSGATHRYLGRQYRLKVTRDIRSGVKLVGSRFQVTVRTGTEGEVHRLLNKWYTAKAEEQFASRLKGWMGWCRQRRLPEPRLCLLRMSKRWGSAHRDGRIFLNPALVKAPSICIDYVVTHEICHLMYPRHDKAFFRLLDTKFPDWRAVKARLEQMDTG